MCASVLKRKNLITSPFTSPLKTPWGGRNMQASKDVCFFEGCARIYVVCFVERSRLGDLSWDHAWEVMAGNSVFSTRLKR